MSRSTKNLSARSGRTEIQLKRAYEPAAKADGYRVLVDRIWPRGITKTRARIDLWLKEIAPGNELRKWFAHDPKKWEEFRKRYQAELRQNPETVARLKEIIRKADVTLVYGARDQEYNQAVALKMFLQGNRSL